MNRLPSILALSLALALGGCAEQYGSLTQRFAESKANARSANASSLALAGVAVQTALYHLTAALSEKLAIDNEQPVPLERLESDDQVTYTVDTEQGTGTIQVLRAGKTVVDLTLRFEQRTLDGGQLFSVETLSGTVEGYQVLLPKLLLTYAFAYDESGNVLQREGKDVVQVLVEANGRLGLSNEPVVEVPLAQLQLQYPLGAGQTKIGRIELVRDELRFEGELTLTDRTIAAQGAILDRTDTKLYDLVADKAGLKLTPIQAPVPVDVQATGEAKL